MRRFIWSVVQVAAAVLAAVILVPLVLAWHLLRFLLTLATGVMMLFTLISAMLQSFAPSAAATHALMQCSLVTLGMFALSSALILVPYFLSVRADMTSSLPATPRG